MSSGTSDEPPKKGPRQDVLCEKEKKTLAPRHGRRAQNRAGIYIKGINYSRINDVLLLCLADSRNTLIRRDAGGNFFVENLEKKKNVFCSPIISPREIGLENSRGKELKVAGSNIAIHTLQSFPMQSKGEIRNSDAAATINRTETQYTDVHTELTSHEESSPSPSCNTWPQGPEKCWATTEERGHRTGAKPKRYRMLLV